MVVVKKNTIILLGNKCKGNSKFLPGERISEGRWVLCVANGVWT